MADFLKVVCGIIENEQGLFLAAKRAKNDYQGGLWEFPGGKPLKNEENQAALKRELQEELNIEVAVGDLIGQSQVTMENLGIHLMAYRCKQTGGKLEKREHDQLLWVDPKSATKMPWAPADQPILVDYLKSIDK